MPADNRITNRHTGSTLEILSSDAATSYGLTPDFLVCDELTHWHGDELWISLFSAAAKKRDCVLVVISNAGTGQGSSWQWRLREQARTDAGWYFSRLDGPVASWISAERLAEQRRLLPSIAYDRLWLNRWTSGSGDALLPDDIDASIRLRGPARGPKPGRIYVAGLDIGLARDATAFCVLSKQVGECRVIPSKAERPHVPREVAIAMDLGLIPTPHRRDAEQVVEIQGTGKLRLTDLKVWRPSGGNRVKLADVERGILVLHERFGFESVSYDPHQAEHLAERLLDAGVPMVRVPFTGAALQGMATSLLDAFTSRTIGLYPHDGLLSDLRSLRVEERSYGIRLTSPRGPKGHGDAATALALACYAAREHVDSAGEWILDDGPLVW